MDLEEEIGLPCHSILSEVQSQLYFAVVFSPLVTYLANCFGNMSEDIPMFEEFTVSLKC